MKVTRRALATALVPAAAALAQTATPSDELKAAQARLKASTDALARQEVPIATEPAFQFKA